MPKSLVFVGSPGPDAPAQLAALAAAGVTPRRLRPEEGLAGLAADPPVALVVDAGVPELAGFMAALREQPALAPLPVVAWIKDPDSGLLDRAFAAGVDDYLPGGAAHQFDALLTAVTAADPWKAVRAPAGRVLLAHGDRLERVRFGAVLRRNGFDPHFAAAAGELVGAVGLVRPRALVATAELVSGSAMSIAGLRTDEGEPLPLVLVARREEIDATRDGLGDRPLARILDSAADAESLTFLLNELLSPAPPNVRRTPRLLYHTPIRFRPVDHAGPAAHGYTFNVNLNGLFLRTLAPLPLQTRLELSFRPPHGRGNVILLAQVMWRKEFADARGAATPPGMGVQFLESWIADEMGYEAGYRQLAEESGEGLVTIPAPPAI
ncbi:MAG TPA: PilZ domain-containing protein [Polyangia bacterium]|nr:PilZ domain-containing protein [Polyangia bacterium]